MADSDLGPKIYMSEGRRGLLTPKSEQGDFFYTLQNKNAIFYKI
jgi:hypothetical protein